MGALWAYFNGCSCLTFATERDRGGLWLPVEEAMAVVPRELMAAVPGELMAAALGELMATEVTAAVPGEAMTG